MFTELERAWKVALRKYEYSGGIPVNIQYRTPNTEYRIMKCVLLLHQPKLLLRLNTRFFHADVPSLESAKFLYWYNANGVVLVGIDTTAQIRLEVRIDGQIALHDGA